MAVDNLIQSGNLILSPLLVLWNSFVMILPSVVLALLLLILGYFIAYLIGRLVRLLLEKVGLDRTIKQSGLSKEMGHTDVPALLGEVVKWFVFLIFLQEAVSILNLTSFTMVLDRFVQWLPNLLVAVVIFFVGVALAHYVGIKMKEHTKMKGMGFFIGVLKLLIIIIVLIMGLDQIGVKIGVLQNTFLILVGAIALGIALALGIGLGFGLKNEATGVVKDFRKHF